MLLTKFCVDQTDGGSEQRGRQQCSHASFVPCPVCSVQLQRADGAPPRIPSYCPGRGPVTTQRQCTRSGMGWLGCPSLSDPGVVLILIQSCAGRRCLQTLFCSHPSLSVLSQTVRSAHNGVTQSSRGSEQMWGSLIASPHHQSSD